MSQPLHVDHFNIHSVGTNLPHLNLYLLRAQTRCEHPQSQDFVIMYAHMLSDSHLCVDCIDYHRRWSHRCIIVVFVVEGGADPDQKVRTRTPYPVYGIS